MNLAVNSQKSKFISELNHLLNLKEKNNKNHSFSQNQSPKKLILS